MGCPVLRPGHGPRLLPSRAREVLMLLPGGMRIDDRAAAIESMSGQPWSSYDLQDVDVRMLGDSAGVVVYGVTASRGTSTPYSALVSSIYVRRGEDWKLAVHQQTQH